MASSIKIIDFQLAKEELRRELDKFRGDLFATVGIHEDKNAPIGEGDMTMARLGATLNYGAEIDHPGGTSYGYATEEAEKEKRVTFLAKGAGYKILGVTQPHKINIPARPWLIPGVQKATQDIVETIGNGVKNGLVSSQILEQVGAIAAGSVQQYMTDLKSPANAKSTIAKKGSSNPLIDTGALRASVTYKVTSDKPEEGI